MIAQLIGVGLDEGLEFMPAGTVHVASHRLVANWRVRCGVQSRKRFLGLRAHGALPLSTRTRPDKSSRYSHLSFRHWMVEPGLCCRRVMAVRWLLALARTTCSLLLKFQVLFCPPSSLLIKFCVLKNTAFSQHTTQYISLKDDEVVSVKLGGRMRQSHAFV